MEQIEASRAPQILTIDHDDTAVELSDDSECSEDEFLNKPNHLGHEETLPAIASSRTFVCVVSCS